MKRQDFKWWQLVLGFIGFFLIMGIVGTIDLNSQVVPDPSPYSRPSDDQLRWPTFCEARIRK